MHVYRGWISPTISKTCFFAELSTSFHNVNLSIFFDPIAVIGLSSREGSGSVTSAAFILKGPSRKLSGVLAADWSVTSHR